MLDFDGTRFPPTTKMCRSVRLTRFPRERGIESLVLNIRRRHRGANAVFKLPLFLTLPLNYTFTLGRRSATLFCLFNGRRGGIEGLSTALYQDTTSGFLTRPLSVKKPGSWSRNWPPHHVSRMVKLFFRVVGMDPTL